MRLTKELAAWLEEVSKSTGLPQGRIVRDALERVRGQCGRQAFLPLAGSVLGAPDLSSCKGFSPP